MPGGPTNHLDPQAITQLATVLESFTGTVIVVTHGRRFLEAFRTTSTVALGAPSEIEATAQQ